MYIIAKELGKLDNIETFSLIQNYEKIDFEENDKFNLIRTFNETDSFHIKASKLHKILTKLKPDLVIQRGLSLHSCFLAKYCRVKGIKFVFMFAHDIESVGIYQSSRKKCHLFNMLLSNSHKLIVQNVHQKKNLESYGVSQSKIAVLKKGLYLNKLPKDVTKKYDGIWIGRCEIWKGPEIFLKFVLENHGRNFIMICSKAPQNEEYFQTIKDEASHLENLEFIEFVENKKIYELLPKSKFFIFTSKQEGDWPMTVLEAAASKVPIISYELNYDDLIDKYMGGVLCHGNSEIMNRAFCDMVDDSDLLYEMGENAYRYVEENHDINKNAQKLVRIIKK